MCPPAVGASIENPHMFPIASFALRIFARTSVEIIGIKRGFLTSGVSVQKNSFGSKLIS